MLQVKDIQEQVKLTSNAKRGMKLNRIDGIETPIELHSIIMWKSITVHRKSLLLDQRTMRANISRHLSLKMKLMDCVAREVESN